MQIEKTNIREVVLANGTVQLDRSAEEDATYEYDAFVMASVIVSANCGDVAAGEGSAFGNAVMGVS